MLDDLLLLRLWAATDAARGETRSRVAADLRLVAGDPTRDKRGWQTTFAEAVAGLATASLLTVGGRGGARLILSEAGRNRMQSVFKISVEHEAAKAGRKRTTGWAWWRDHYAVPAALGEEQPGSADELRGVLLRRLFLPELKVGRRPPSLKKMVDLLLAKRLKVDQIGPAAFRQAALRDWMKASSLDETNPHVAAASPGNTLASPAGRLSDDLTLFAEQALAAARRSRTGRFGDAKVFISHVWRDLLAAGHAAPEEFDEFKARLVRANTAGRLHLSRADLAGAHAGEDVRASELHYLGEKFHFVRLD